MREKRRFDEYTRGEAEDVTETFLAATRRIQLKRADTELWTEWVLDWFAASAGENVLVDARRSRCGAGRAGSWPPSTLEAFHPDWKTPRTTGGEFLVDLCHTTFPSYQGWGTPEYWEGAFDAHAIAPAIRLALESEFGSGTNPDLNLHRVMEDASKLLVLCARVKVMVFASTNQDNRKRIIELASQIAKHDRSGETTWVWVDLPWNESWTGKDVPKKWVLPAAPCT